MKLLLDANLSWRLVRRLSNDFAVVEHVTRTGLPIPADDKEIWDWALANDFIIVTNDEDFSNLLILRGFPPKVVLLRRGNQTTDQVAALIIASRNDIEALHKNTHYGLLEIY
jgi:predicted nuclease of predicted toxin-antitoxin system